jgi:transposase InsO family protein
MDRGKGCLHNNIKDRPKILLAKHCLPLRSTSELTVDNGKQFDSQDFKDFCFSIGTKLAFASVYHLQSNEVVERANGKIFTTVKKMLLDEKRASGPICYLRRSGH